ncbi:hypothetical protein [Sphingomonas kyeonggiensis]|nr:hypothetical protein [Sphingomonas kyeonggiensis]
MLAEPVRSAATEADDILGLLNAVAITAGQFQGAMETLAALPDPARRDPAAQAIALQAYASDAGLGEDPLVSAALHARITALAKWTTAWDPDRQSDVQAVIDSAVRFPLSAGVNGIAFEPAGFQELILFIEALPW